MKAGVSLLHKCSSGSNLLPLLKRDSNGWSCLSGFWVLGLVSFSDALVVEGFLEWLNDWKVMRF